MDLTPPEHLPGGSTASGVDPSIALAPSTSEIAQPTAGAHSPSVSIASPPLQAPEGFDLDPQVTAELQALASEYQLKPEQTQKLADLGVKMMHSWQEQQATQNQNLWGQWAQASKTDPEFGGDALPENLAVAKQALKRFGSPELQNLLDQTGLGSHPEVIRAFYRAGQSIQDPVVSGSAPKVRPTAAQVLYGDRV